MLILFLFVHILFAHSDASIIAEVYIPTAFQLQSLFPQLQAEQLPIRGSDIDNYERIFVTCILNNNHFYLQNPIADQCQYRVRMSSIGKTGQALFHGSVRSMGCTLTLDNQYAECQLSVPTSLQNHERKINIHLEQVQQDCLLPSIDAFLVSLEPNRVISECEENFFWNEDDSQCETCELTASRSLCQNGAFVAGCDVVSSQSYCEDCTKVEGLGFDESQHTWIDGICKFACKQEDLGKFMDAETKACSACTAEKQGKCPVGMKWQACTDFENEKCISCDPIDKGSFSANEHFLPTTAEGVECSTACVTGTYWNADIDICQPCKSYEELSLEVNAERSKIGQYYKFHECTQHRNASATNSYYEECSNPPANAYFISDADGFGIDCASQCEEGYRALGTTSNCSYCPPLFDVLGLPLPREAFEYTSITAYDCSYTCSEGYQKLPTNDELVYFWARSLNMTQNISSVLHTRELFFSTPTTTAISSSTSSFQTTTTTEAITSTPQPQLYCEDDPTWTYSVDRLSTCNNFLNFREYCSVAMACDACQVACFNAPGCQHQCVLRPTTTPSVIPICSDDPTWIREPDVTCAALKSNTAYCHFFEVCETCSLTCYNAIGCQSNCIYPSTTTTSPSPTTTSSTAAETSTTSHAPTTSTTQAATTSSTAAPTTSTTPEPSTSTTHTSSTTTPQPTTITSSSSSTSSALTTSAAASTTTSTTSSVITTSTSTTTEVSTSTSLPPTTTVVTTTTTPPPCIEPDARDTENFDFWHGTSFANMYVGCEYVIYTESKCASLLACLTCPETCALLQGSQCRSIISVCGATTSTTQAPTTSTTTTAVITTTTTPSPTTSTTTTPLITTTTTPTPPVILDNMLVLHNCRQDYHWRATCCAPYIKQTVVNAPIVQSFQCSAPMWWAYEVDGFYHSCVKKDKHNCFAYFGPGGGSMSSMRTPLRAVQESHLLPYAWCPTYENTNLPQICAEEKDGQTSTIYFTWNNQYGMFNSQYNSMFSATGYCQCAACAAICTERVFGFNFEDYGEELSAANICGGSSDCCEATHISESTAYTNIANLYHDYITSGTFTIETAVPDTILVGYVAQTSYRAAQMICQRISEASTANDVWVKREIFFTMDNIWLSDLKCTQQAYNLSDCGFEFFNVTDQMQETEIDSVCCANFNNESTCTDTDTANTNACEVALLHFNSSINLDNSIPETSFEYEELSQTPQQCTNGLEYDWGCLQCPNSTHISDIDPVVYLSAFELNITLTLDLQQWNNNSTLYYYNEEYYLLFEPEPNCF